jgi:hypothetical protein
VNSDEPPPRGRNSPRTATDASHVASPRLVARSRRSAPLSRLQCRRKRALVFGLRPAARASSRSAPLRRSAVRPGRVRRLTRTGNPSIEVRSLPRPGAPTGARVGRGVAKRGFPQGQCFCPSPLTSAASSRAWFQSGGAGGRLTGFGARVRQSAAAASTLARNRPAGGTRQARPRQQRQGGLRPGSGPATSREPLRR